MTNLRKLFVIVAVLPVVLGVARSARANEPPPDLCTLLSAADVSKTLGQTYAAPDKSVAPRPYKDTVEGTDCRYHGKESTLWFRAYADPSADTAKDLFAKLGIFYSPKTAVADLGDEAYFDREHALHVRKGKVRFYINLHPMNFTPAVEKQIKDLANKVIGQL